MPGALLSGYKLGELTTPIDKKMRGHPETKQLLKVGVARTIQSVTKKSVHRTRAELSWRQADAVNDQQINLCVRRSRIVIWRIAVAHTL